jgi:hypothetical protein
VLPRSGQTGVPTNARLWRLPGSGFTTTPDQRIQSYDLAPHTAYELTSLNLSFTTGDGPDDAPPVPPTIGTVAITLDHPLVEGGHPIWLLRISGSFDSDTAVVRVALTSAAGTVTYYTTPDELSVCHTGVPLAPGNADVAITAIDLAGNESAPVTYNATATVAPDDFPGCHEIRGGDPHCGIIWLIRVMGAWTLLSIASIGYLLIGGAVRASRRETAAAEPFAIPAVEALARAVRLRAAATIAAVAAAASFSTRSDEMTMVATLAAPAVATVVCVALARWVRAARTLVLTAYDGAIAEVRRDQVTVSVGGKTERMYASPKCVQRARAHGVPRATL